MDADRVWVIAIRKDSGGVVRVTLAPQDQEPFLVSDLKVRDPIFIGVLRVVREQVHETVGVFVVIDGRFVLGNIPLPADRSQIDQERLRRMFYIKASSPGPRSPVETKKMIAIQAVGKGA